jgi:CRISPR-associated protein Cst1
MPALVTYVGDPFVDTGVAVLEHQLGKPCEEFSEGDLLAEGAKLLKIYSQKQWRGILMLHFPNSGWTNPTMGVEKVAEFHRKVLEGFRRETETGRFCEYCRRPAHSIVDGSMVPLLSNANSMDCGSGGRPGFAICGSCLFAIQFYPLATLKVEGKALFWWSQDHEWTFLLAGIAISEVRRFLAASPDGTIKTRFPWSRLLTVAREAFESWRDQRDPIPLRDIVGCHTTNYRTSPEFEELRIPRELLLFWYEASSGFGAVYDSVVSSAWASNTDKRAKGKKPKKDAENEWARRNGLYESLGAAFQSDDFRRQAAAVATKYFIKIGKTAPQPGSFELACLFLERLASMRKSRVEAIREIGDRIAGSSERTRLLERLWPPNNFLGGLVYAQHRMQKAGETPLRFDAILTALDLVSEDDSLPQNFWLVRDLIILRVLEQVDPETLSELPEPALETPLAEGKED